MGVKPEGLVHPIGAVDAYPCFWFPLIMPNTRSRRRARRPLCAREIRSAQQARWRALPFLNRRHGGIFRRGLSRCGGLAVIVAWRAACESNPTFPKVANVEVYTWGTIGMTTWAWSARSAPASVRTASLPTKGTKSNPRAVAMVVANPANTIAGRATVKS
jgi:hypothetical protein